MNWVIEQLYSTLNRTGIGSYKRFGNKDCHYDHQDIVEVSSEFVDFLSKDEQLIMLLKELGINGFNDWYKETFGKPAPFRYHRNMGGGFTRKVIVIKQEIIEEEEWTLQETTS